MGKLDHLRFILADQGISQGADIVCVEKAALIDMNNVHNPMKHIILSDVSKRDIRTIATDTNPRFRNTAMTNRLRDERTMCNPHATEM
ncbi:MAG TPA: hypothetical protein ACQGQH_03720 [Xylella sp.]